MIADLDESIRQLLVAEIPVKNGEIGISFDLPKREWSSRLSRPTVNLFMYDLRENVVLRQHQWERMAEIRPGDNQAHLKRTPFRVDCFYMLTTWAAEAEDEHRLLSRCMMVLFRFPIIPQERLVGLLQKQPYEIQARLASHDKLTNPAEVWSSLDNEMHPSIPFIVTVSLDPWTEVTGPIVRTLTMRTGQTLTLPRREMLVEDPNRHEFIYFGGTIRSKKAPQDPIPGLQVAVKGTGLFTTTDENGQYALGSLPPGEYSLVVWTGEGKTIEKKISLPPGREPFDLEL